MTENPYGAFGLAELETLRDRYVSRGDGAKVKQVAEAISGLGAVQTEALAHSGKLFAHESPRDSTGRITTSWTGDNGAWMSAFMTGSRVGTINVEMAKESARASGRGRAT